MWQNGIFNQIYFNSKVFNIRLYKTATWYQLIKYENKKICNDHHFTQQNAKFWPKSESTTKHRMFRATNLRQSREFYTNAVGDVGDI